MSNVNKFMTSVRAKSVMRDIASANNRLMACGDSRIAHQTAIFGLTVLVEPDRREFTGSYRLTAAGVEWVKRNLKIEAEKEAIIDG